MLCEMLSLSCCSCEQERIHARTTMRTKLRLWRIRTCSCGCGYIRGNFRGEDCSRRWRDEVFALQCLE